MDETASQTIDLLEARLLRIRYVLEGFPDQIDVEPEHLRPETRKPTVTARLAALEHALSKLSTRSKVVHDVLKLYARHPDVFQRESTTEAPDSLSNDALLAMVVSQAALYSSVSSGLKSLLDIPIPSADASVEMMALLPRIAELDRSVERQARELAELREKTATVCWRWYQITVLGGGECWAEWDDRASRVDRGIRRLELARD